VYSQLRSIPASDPVASLCHSSSIRCPVCTSLHTLESRKMLCVNKHKIRCVATNVHTACMVDAEGLLSYCVGFVLLQDAPYKKRGMIPYGVQRGSYGLTAEEKMRRRWREWSAAGSSANGSGSPALAAAAGDPSYQVRHLTPLVKNWCSGCRRQPPCKLWQGSHSCTFGPGTMCSALTILCLRCPVDCAGGLAGPGGVLPGCVC
jgi:hypothetical protein